MTSVSCAVASDANAPSASCQPESCATWRVSCFVVSVDLRRTACCRPALPHSSRTTRPYRNTASPRLDRPAHVHIQRVQRMAARHEQPVVLRTAEAQVGAALGQLDARRAPCPPGRTRARRRGPRRRRRRAVVAPAAPHVAVDVDRDAVERAGALRVEVQALVRRACRRRPRRRPRSAGAARRGSRPRRAPTRRARRPGRWAPPGRR